MSPGTFAAFSKFHLNTSNYPNVKVVYVVEEHNFHVEWHLRFGVEMREKAWSTLIVTIHWCPGNCETNRISVDGNPTLCTSVVVPGELPHASPISVIPKIHTER
jgi:hypothetical protein